MTRVNCMQLVSTKILIFISASDIQWRRQLSDIQQTHTHTHPFNGPMYRTTQVSRYQKCITNLDFTEARDSEWQWHQLGHMQVCT